MRTTAVRSNPACTSLKGVRARSNRADPRGDDAVSTEGGGRAGEEPEHRLWPGIAPGSEGSAQNEEVVELGGEGHVRNVVVPTLTVVTPAGADRTGPERSSPPAGGFTCCRGRARGSDWPAGSPPGA